MCEVIPEHVRTHRDGKRIIHERGECHVQDINSAEGTACDLLYFFLSRAAYLIHKLTTLRFAQICYQINV